MVRHHVHDLCSGPKDSNRHSGRARRVGLAASLQARFQKDARNYSDHALADISGSRAAGQSSCVEHCACFFATRTFKASPRTAEETVALPTEAREVILRPWVLRYAIPAAVA